MGREIRRVPPNWEHPKYHTTQFSPGRGLEYLEVDKPLHDENFDVAARNWINGLIEFEKNGPRVDDEGKPEYYWDWERQQPTSDDYRHYTDDEATWYQVYETVSEGTPVTPPFATLDEIVAYLSTKGDYWDQRRGTGPWSKEGAASFCESGYAPSMIVTGGKVFEPKDQHEVPNNA